MAKRDDTRTSKQRYDASLSRDHFSLWGLRVFYVVFVIGMAAFLYTFEANSDHNFKEALITSCNRGDSFRTQVNQFFGATKSFIVAAQVHAEQREKVDATAKAKALDKAGAATYADIAAAMKQVTVPNCAVTVNMDLKKNVHLPWIPLVGNGD